MNFAWGAETHPLEPIMPMSTRLFTGERPPARRTTDKAMAALSVGMTLIVAAVIARAALRGDWVAVWTFAPGGILIATASTVLCTIVINWGRTQRAGRARSAEELAEQLLARPVVIADPIPVRKDRTR